MSLARLRRGPRLPRPEPAFLPLSACLPGSNRTGDQQEALGAGSGPAQPRQPLPSRHQEGARQEHETHGEWVLVGALGRRGDG